ncbi:coiled-coil domain-containing protein 134-like [Macrobrachium rosenbergii]|uniref:coiled-coil domain-containing protein 134-like n=1 Tax=Macrobrachium rosenbergii TaxID=79674 RepID=UPI0034D55E1B
MAGVRWSFILCVTVTLCTRSCVPTAANDVNQVNLFQSLFQKKRGEHKSAVTTILAFNNYVKQYNMVKLIAEKVFQVLEISQVTLREKGFVPGMEFPEDGTVREALAQTLENTAFMGEVLLHLPDITHSILKNNKPWQLLFTWGIFFASQSKFLDKNTSHFIYLVSQEMGVTEKDPHYVNPYSKENARVSGEWSRRKEGNSKEKKKQRKTFKKGPQLSRSYGDL